MRYELKNVRATPFAAVAPAPGLALRYGDTFKLSHVMSGRTLHSHLHNYGHARGSSQQQVTAFGGPTTTTSGASRARTASPSTSGPGNPFTTGTSSG